MPSEGFRELPTVSADGARQAQASPERIGRYHIKRVIASGGMGTVYEATQDNPRRVVAVKVMKQGIASKSALRRFEYEGQILGRLRHPGIAQIYEAGTHHDPAAHGAPVPYFAMEYIPNAKTVTTYADEKKLGTRQRMELFAKVCDAIHHGHQKGIIHRDLKPSNILVDSTGQVKIIDFGVARCTDSDLAVTTLQTDVGQLIGTLQYMSPEQCEGDPHDIDTRSDVYALGVVFYQLLCGKLPYDVTRMAMHQATRAIREQHPTKLSTLDKTLRGDVETIALKALEKERERRYQSAADLGHDIHRYLTGEAILARRASIVYQLRLFARRNKAVFASLAAVFIVLLTGIIVSTSLYLRAEHARADQSRERERAEMEREKAENFAEFMEQTLKGVGPSVALGRDTKILKELMDAAAKRIGDGQLGAIADAELRLRATIGAVYRDIAEYDEAEKMLVPAIELAERIHGRESAEYATALDAHAVWLRSVGRYAEALPKLEHALAIRQRVFRGDHPAVATSLNNVGECLDKLGRTTERLSYLEQALTMRQRLFPGDHPDVAASLNNVAFSLNTLGRLDEALLKYEEGLAMCRRLYSGDHPDVAAHLLNLGYCLENMGHLEHALSKFEEALGMFQRLFPGDHPTVGTSLNNVAHCLLALGRTEEALQRFEQALAMYRRLFSGDHPSVAIGLNNIAYCLGSLGRTEEALPKAEEALAMAKRTLPPEHPNVSSAQIGLGSVLTTMGRYADAEPLLISTWDAIANHSVSPVPDRYKRRCPAALIKLYSAKDAAEPGKGYAEKGAEWREKLNETKARP